MNDLLRRATEKTDSIAAFLGETAARIEAEIAPAILSGAAEADAIAGDLVRAYVPEIRSFLDDAYGSLSAADAALDPPSFATSQRYHRLRVQPLFLGSKFVRWSLDKPLGYPGDFAIVEMLFDNRPDGETPFARAIAEYVLDCGPARGHRARLPWAHAWLREHAKTLGGAPLEILSFACGPERVLREYIRTGDGSRLTLADFDRRALGHAERNLQRVIGERAASTQVRSIRVSALDLIGDESAARGLASTRADGLYDAVLVLGLLDYLENDPCTKLIAALADVLAPGGLCLLTNLHSVNPWRSFMEHVGGWQTIHRSKELFADIIGRAGVFSSFELTTDPSETNLLFRGRRRP